MAWSLDARVPIVFADAGLAGPDDAVLSDTAVPAGWVGAWARFTGDGGPAHPVGCACCVGQHPAADALGRLFVGRAKGDVAFFRRVVAVVADPAALRRSIEDDPMVSGRFRFD